MNAITPRAPPVLMPANPAEAASCHGVFVAGGTALQLAWNQTPPTDPLIDLRQLGAARGITLDNATLRIGALETLETCRTHPLIHRHAPLLAEACAAIGALGVRTLATIGGNIGWRQGDTIPVLLAIGARVECLDTVRPLPDILASPTIPLLLAIRIPLPAANRIAIFEKVGHRAAFTLSFITVAAVSDATTSRLAVGGAGFPARRLPHAEALLTQSPPDWTALAATIRTETGGGERGTVASRVLTGHLRAAANP